MNTTPPVIRLDGPGVTVDEVVAVAHDRVGAELTPAAIERMKASRAVVDRLAAGSDAVYGLSTGFGALANVSIPPERRQDLQHALVRSHAAGMGDPVEAEVVRAMMFLRARTLALGFSGARPLVAQAMLHVVNVGIVPVVPEYGSLGASGDLAPLAHAALTLLGEGEVFVDGQRQPAAEALAKAQLAPITLSEKEGLAVTNGTDGILGMLCLAIHDAQALLTQADITAAVTVEGLLATDRAFAADLLALRPHPGQAVSADNLRTHAGRLADRRQPSRTRLAGAGRLLDPVHPTGARRRSRHARPRPPRRRVGAGGSDRQPDGAARRPRRVGRQLPRGSTRVRRRLPGDRPHRSRSDRRATDRPCARSHPIHGLPPFLANEVGVDSGLMIGQYTAASMCAENRRLAAPASVDSLPTSGMQEDHVSMAWGAVRKLRKVVDNLRRILAIELVIGARAVDLRAPLRPAPATGAVIAALRDVVPGPGPDRVLSPDLLAAESFLGNGEPTVALGAVGITLS